LGGLDLDGVLNDPFGVVEHQIWNSPAEKSRPMLDACYRLPLNLPSTKKSNFVSPGMTNLPKIVIPVSPAIEKLIITTLLNCLKETFDFDLSFVRTLTTQ
jgi:hypothetical protein